MTDTRARGVKELLKDEPLVKGFMIRVFDVGNKRATTRRFHAPGGNGYTAEAIDGMLGVIAEDLERKLPKDEYSLVEVNPTHFNFVWRGKRNPQASQDPAEG